MTDATSLTDQVKSAFAAEVRSARARHQKEQREVAEKAGISCTTLISIEKGRTCPSLAVAVRIAKALHISLDTLL